ncbi:hypothetical protein T12_4082 [Trichinella patagoniensis]|uniref:Uncharacterized protein n=1 Tax=Trichinella patagoniensis TaxID=990121 RepID=A0A0V0ZQ19_9BILA|nr:hypothetical protein T12_4082 [Trichinella patagoniensis]
MKALSVKYDDGNCCSNQASVLNCNGKTTMKNVASELLNSFEKLPAEMCLSSVVRIMSQDTTGSEVSSGSLFQHWVFPNKDELHKQMVKLNMAKKDERKWRSQNVLQIRYQCKETRKFPYCDAYFSARCEADGTVESYGGVVHNHSFRKPTTRLPSPTREKVLQCLKNGINDMKTIQNILIKKGYNASQGQLRHLVYYHRRKELKKPS